MNYGQNKYINTEEKEVLTQCIYLLYTLVSLEI